MKILLATPPWKTTELWPPLGLLYLAGTLKRSRGDDVAVVDAFCENLTREEFLGRVEEERPSLLGMNCSTHTFLETIETLREARRRFPDMLIVLGGYHATFAAKEILHAYRFVDYIIKGEAEFALPRLLDHLDDGTDPGDVEGISYIAPGGAVVENPLSLVEDLDALPFPDRSLLDRVSYGYYFQGIPLTFGKFTTVSTSRGCPFSCSYCSCAAFSERKWRYRSARNVVDELETLYRQGYRECVFVDDNFTNDPARVEELCSLIRERGIRMKLYCEGRAGQASLPLLKNMKAAGFNVIYFGAESASPHVLEYYNKKQPAERIARAVANAKKAGMLVITSYIIGAPVESKEDIRTTIRFAGSLRPHGVQYNILDYLLGTPLWSDLKARGAVGEEDWKTNHRVYEYYPQNASRGELESLADEGYGSFLGAWKNLGGLAELIRVLLVNSTARRVVFGNLANPAVRKVLANGLRTFGPGSRTGPAGEG